MRAWISAGGTEKRPVADAHRLSRLDRVGVLLSSICLVHCLALPLVIALLPALASVMPPDLWVHAVLIGVALPVTGFTLWRGYLAHGNPRPLLIGISGLGIVLCGLLTGGAAIAAAVVTVTGGLIVAGAHLMNLRDHSALCLGGSHPS